MARVDKINRFLPDQYFTRLYFANSINNINSATFDLVQYLPNIIHDVQDIDYANDTTYINHNSILQNSITNNVLNANELQSFKITANENQYY
jgi:hypothetical protein